MAITKKKKEKKLKLELKKRQKIALQAEIVRRKLLQAIAKKEGRPVAILRKIEDKIPNVFTKKRDEEIKPTFLEKGGLIK